MDAPERETAFMSALVTEHFVLQTATSTAASEAASRASLYLLSLSSSLVAMGFVLQAGDDAFVPFAATVLPALVLLGTFTVLRLVDTAVENLQFLAGIARIRGYYRTLTPDAERYFAPQGGRWPEATMLAARRGPFPLFFTPASMIAFINSIVAGAGVALLASEVLGGDLTALAVGLGAVVAVALAAACLAFQRWRYAIFATADTPAP